MKPEEIDVLDWQRRQLEIEQTQEALTQADSGRLLEHSSLSETPVTGAVRIRWADSVVTHLRSLSYHVGRCEGGSATADSFLDKVYATVEFIGAHPNLGCVGRVSGTREWSKGFGFSVVPTVLNGELQVLGVFHSLRKVPQMKPGIA